jgi:LETM1 and EF-hand domain-containing protein 1
VLLLALLAAARERAFVARTLKDVLRLVPFAAVFALPGGAALVPIMAKVLPGLLPTTFNLPSRASLRRECGGSGGGIVAVGDGGGPGKSGDAHSLVSEAELAAAMLRLCPDAGAAPVPQLAWTRISDVDIFARATPGDLQAMRDVLQLAGAGDDALLTRLREINAHDEDLAREWASGETMSEADIEQACRVRGLLGGHARDRRELADRLEGWLVATVGMYAPSTLLLLLLKKEASNS